MYVNFESFIHLTRATIIRQGLVYYYPIRGPELVIIFNMAVYKLAYKPYDTRFSVHKHTYIIIISKQLFLSSGQ